MLIPQEMNKKVQEESDKKKEKPFFKPAPLVTPELVQAKWIQKPPDA